MQAIHRIQGAVTLLAHSSFLHAGSWWRARQEMGKLIANYDSSTAGDALLRALVACGASDVAHSLSQSPSASQVCVTLFQMYATMAFAQAHHWVGADLYLIGWTMLYESRS